MPDITHDLRQSLLREIAALTRDPEDGFDVVIGDEAINGGLVFDAHHIELADHDTLNNPGWGIEPNPSAEAFTLLLTHDAKVIGQLSISLDRFGICIEGVAVDFRYRGQEYSQKLIDTCVGLFSRAVEGVPDGMDASWIFDHEVLGNFNDAGEHFAVRLSESLESAFTRLDMSRPEIA